jgi:hypothetical protein
MVWEMGLSSTLSAPSINFRVVDVTYPRLVVARRPKNDIAVTLGYVPPQDTGIALADAGKGPKMA